MRQGTNPAKNTLPAYTPKKLGVLLLAYIPSLDGYFKQSLDILKYQIASLHKAATDFDLHVFDNGSCAEVQTELFRLHERGLIHLLFLSNFNVGKTGAFNRILGSMPNELLCYADGDVLFREGWLDQSLQILEAFPQAGLITAQPCFLDNLRGQGQAIAQLRQDANIAFHEESLPVWMKQEFARSVDLDDELMPQFRQSTSTLVENVALKTRAVVNGSHMQFLIRREALQDILPLPAEMALSTVEDNELNRRLDAAGFLALSTLEPYVLHMGNRLDPQTLVEIQAMGLDVILETFTKPRLLMVETRGAKRWTFRVLDVLSRFAFVRNFLQRLNNFLFEFFTRQS